MNSNSGQEPRYLSALVVLTTLFFMWGLITSLNDILIPHLKALFTLSFVQASLVQFCFFGAYAIASLPSGYLVERIGYRKGIIIGLSIAGVGCLLFYPAASQQVYALFLGALFVLACGITLLQVAANPYVAVLGPPRTSSSRLTLTQAFNSAGTTIGPWLGANVILAGALGGAAVGSARDVEAVQGLYIALAAVLFVIALAFSRFKLPVVPGTDATTDAANDPNAKKSVWEHSHLVLGAVAIFMYVGAEVSIASWAVNFMELPEVAGLDSKTAGEYLIYYWGGAMVGRFIGSAVLRVVKPGYVLAFNAAVAIALLLIAISSGGKLAMWSVLAIGLFNSIMFPTIFTLALARLGRHTGEGSGILCVAIVGGALVPMLQAAFADTIGLLASFFVPAVCYAYIVFYGLKGHIVRSVPDAEIPASGARANM
ncbi:MFS transporter [Steroidobacter agaridevorans]|uniref:MFS transporter n=1 Tax=Steroidobacter agaridevorans TaxID=2695856 RepID=A0A829YEM1_9GAMM|nr:sugar MFS transporter [Steroidobacter agaridevorans]GFE81670.1 MFS transporter [Steroidobacter agaridevorans]